MNRLVRTYSSMVPPRISSLREIGKLTSKYPQAHPELFSKMKLFYSRLPKGPRPASAKGGFLEWYYKTYVSTSSFMPFVHFVGIMVPLGYYCTYFKGGHYHPSREFH